METISWVKVIMIVWVVSFSLGWGIGRHFLSKVFRELLQETEDNILENMKRKD